MKKLISILLLAGMMTGLLVSCAEEKKPATTTAPGNNTGTVTDDLPDNLDFGGQEIKVICADEEITMLSFVADEENEDLVSQKIYERNLAIEKRLGVNIEIVETATHEEVASTAQLIIASGGEDYDIVGGYQYFSVGLAVGGYLYNLKGQEINDIGYLNFEKPYWSSQFMDNIAVDGAAYWATGDVSLRYTSGMYCTFVNTEIFNRLFPEENIYDIARNGEWTLDKLSEMSSKAYDDLTGDSEYNDGDQFGFISGAYDLMDGLAVGCGVTFSQMYDGEITVTLGNSTGLAFADKLKELCLLPSTRVVSVTEQDWCPTNFVQGNALFLVDKLMTAEYNFREMENYAIIPSPKLNAEQATYLTTLHDGITILGIPSSLSAETLPGVCATMEAMASGSYNNVTPAYYESALKVKYTRDEVAGEMIDLIRENVTTDFAFAYSHSVNDIAWYFRNNYKGGSAQLKRTVKSNSDVWAGSISTIVEGLKEAA